MIVGTTATPKMEKANQVCSHAHFRLSFMGRAYAAFMIAAHRTNTIAWTVCEVIIFPCANPDRSALRGRAEFDIHRVNGSRAIEASGYSYVNRIDDRNF